MTTRPARGGRAAADVPQGPPADGEAGASVLVVSGSRNWPKDNLWFVTAVLIEHRQRGEVVRHGDAPDGVDRHVKTECIRLRWPQDAVPADWTPNGVFDRAAGFKRNDAMMEKDPRPRLLLAFQWDGSGGTGHAIGAARRRGIPARVYTEADLRPDLAALDYEDEPIYFPGSQLSLRSTGARDA